MTTASITISNDSEQASGNKELYKHRLSGIVCNNPTVALVCGFHAASTFLKYIHEMELNPAWSLMGDSAIGKTLAVQTAISMRCNPITNLCTLYHTPKNLAQRMKKFDGVGGVVDEVGFYRSKKERQLVLYNMISGRDPSRSPMRQNKTTDEWYEPQSQSRSHFTLLLTGEDGLVNVKNEPAWNRRIIENQFSLDDPLWHGITTKEQAEEWGRFIVQNHGHLYPAMTAKAQSNPNRYLDFYELKKILLSGINAGQTPERNVQTYALALAGLALIADVLNQSNPYASEVAAKLMMSAKW